AQGLAKVKVLAAALREAVKGSVHPLVREPGQRYLNHIARLDVEVAELDKRLRQLTKDDETSIRSSEHAGDWSDHRRGDRGLCATDGNLQARTRLCCLARSRSAATHDRRQAEAGPYIKDGAACDRSPDAHWCHGCWDVGGAAR